MPIPSLIILNQTISQQGAAISEVKQQIRECGRNYQYIMQITYHVQKP